MSRRIMINWTPPVEYVGAVRSALEPGLPKMGPASHHTIVERMRDHFGLYMFFEAQGVEPDRDDAIRAWRRENALKPFARRNLVYIGIVKSDRRDFIMRMKDHESDWLHQYRAKQLYVKFGVAQYTCKEAELPQLIEDAESMLIFEMQPHENTAKKYSYTMDISKGHLVVASSGSHHPLPKRLSSKRHLTD